MLGTCYGCRVSRIRSPRTLISLLIVFCLTTSAHAKRQITLGYGGTSLSHISVVILQQAYARLGIDTESRQLPAARSLFMANQGHTDGEINRIAAIAPDNPNLIRIPIPVNRLEAVALTCGKTIQADLDTLAHLRVGIKIGNQYAKNLTEKFPAVVRLSNENKLLDLLLAGRLDTIIVDRAWALSIQQAPRHECLVINAPVLTSIPLYHYLHKRHADLVPDITRVLREMQDSGELEAIREKFIQSLSAP